MFGFGDATYEGSAAGGRLPAPIVAVSSAAGAAVPGTASCPTTPPLAGQGTVIAQSVTVPAVPVEALTGSSSLVNPPASDVPASYPGTVLRAANTTTYPGARPAVVVLHGLDGDQCQMYWLASDLAGNGFVALVLTSPTPPDEAASEGVEIDAARSAVDFLGTAANPFLSQTNAGNVGVAGWSEGSIAASVVQELPDMHPVRAIVALDSLRAALRGDPGVPETFCLPPVEGPITPVVPALGLSEDAPCDVAPSNLAANLKLAAWSEWASAGVPAVELPLAGFNHFSFGSPTQLVGDLTVGWFEAWLENSSAALSLYTSCSVSGLPLAGVLSALFDSGAFLPSLQLSTGNYAQAVAQR
ncbi:MAG: alpha/beta hydrolase family protein, partial [Acidimicrobiales bacterium]